MERGGGMNGEGWWMRDASKNVERGMKRVEEE